MVDADPRHQLGRRSERVALEFLRAQGYVIERTNVRFPVGEIDILAREGATLCFVEVRSASSLQWGGSLASVGERKQRRLLRAARWYLHRLRERPPEIRFDVVAIDWQAGRVSNLELVRGAFDAGGTAVF
ncbi:MAG: YraN family protein [Candidatus Omnitrophica bacterium]|nr:YraN family protein [Candidatus Omnitrophota bacterium]